MSFSQLSDLAKQRILQTANHFFSSGELKHFALTDSQLRGHQGAPRFRATTYSQSRALTLLASLANFARHHAVNQPATQTHSVQIDFTISSASGHEGVRRVSRDSSLFQRAAAVLRKLERQLRRAEPHVAGLDAAKSNSTQRFTLLMSP
jgi:hypothetical protein